MSVNVHYINTDMDFKYMDDEDDSETEGVKPKTEPVSPNLVNFKTRTIQSAGNYTNGLKEITPSNISTPTASMSSLSNKDKGYNYNRSWGRADGQSMDDNQGTEITTLGSTKNLYTDDDTEKESKKSSVGRFCKYFITVVVILMGIAAVIVIILTNTDKKYPPVADKQTQDECGIYLLNLIKYMQPVDVEFNCTFSKNVSTAVTKIKIKFEPTYRYLPQSEHIEENFNLSSSTKQSLAKIINRWNLSCNVVDNHLKCDLKREPVRCDNGGIISVTLYKNGEELQRKEVEFDVEGEVSQVEMNVNQTVDGADNSTIVDIACSTQSSCTPTSIWLFSKKDGITVRRYDINFTCLIQYNTQDGTTVDCTGSIPGSLIKSFGTILCRPHLNDSMEAEAKEASVKPPVCEGDECTFTCPDEDGDIYYIDPLDCTKFHRCASRRLYSGPCSNSTYFNTLTCSCDHQKNVPDCDSNGMRVAKAERIRCGNSTSS